MRSVSTLRSCVVSMSAVTVAPSGMSLAAIDRRAATVGIALSGCAGVCCLLKEQRDADEGDDRQEHPDEQDKPI